MEVYQSNIMQALAIKSTIVNQRCDSFNSYGVFYWHMNDAWPSITCSTVDYYGKWKAGQYALKTYYTPVAAFFYERILAGQRIKQLEVSAVNNKLYTVVILIRVRVVTTEGHVLMKTAKSVTVAPNSQVRAMVIEAKGLKDYNQYGKEKMIFYLEAIESKYNVMRTTHFLVRHKYLAIPKATLNVRFSDS